MKKICVVTGTRAEYGLLQGLMESINQDKEMMLQIIVTGMHLSSEFGLTYKEIEKDGFIINKKIEMLIASDKPTSITKSTGIGLIGFADAFDELDPDIIVVLGDRFEIFAASIAALYAKIPIAHLHGGESTIGAYDEAMRHSITKMASWHFVAAKNYENRVIQLGENPKRIFNVGGLGIDMINNSKLLSKGILSKRTGINFSDKNLLITFHPETLRRSIVQNSFQSLLEVLDGLNDIYLIFTMPNADSGNRIIIDMINEFVTKNKDRSISFLSMGQINYLSTLKFVDGVIGNSSSGIIEAPSFKVGTINIGDRQTGRLKAESIIDCYCNKKSIAKAIKKLYSDSFQNSLKNVKNPYGNGGATKKIIDIIRSIKLPVELKKEFYNLYD